LLGVFLLGLFTTCARNRANVIAMAVMAIVNFTLLILTERNIVVVGWTWLVIIGTFGTMAISYALGPLIGEKQHAA
jgi:hypothetical protein